MTRRLLWIATLVGACASAPIVRAPLPLCAGDQAQRLLQVEREAESKESRSVPLRQTLASNRTKSALTERAEKTVHSLLAKFFQREAMAHDDEYLGLIAKESLQLAQEFISVGRCKQEPSGAFLCRGEFQLDAWLSAVSSSSTLPVTFRDLVAAERETEWRELCK